MSAPRYTVRMESSVLQNLGFVAWVHDAQCPPHAPHSLLCWCGSADAAERIAAGLNRDEMFRERLRFLIIDEDVGPIERGDGP